VISKCANPACGEPFRYLREGKLFRVDLDQLENRAAGKSDSEKVWHRLEHFWLCGRCAATMTLVAERGRGISTVPLSQVLRKAS
jgi:hypothetical protein